MLDSKVWAAGLDGGSPGDVFKVDVLAVGHQHRIHVATASDSCQRGIVTTVVLCFIARLMKCASV